MSKPVILQKAQEVHGKEVLATTIKYGWHSNPSPTGTGKTTLTVWLKQQLEKHHGKEVKLLTVGPANIRPVKKLKVGHIPTSPWQRESVQYEEPFDFESYEKLRGRELPGEITLESPPESISTLGDLDTLPSVVEKFDWMDHHEEMSSAKYYSNVRQLLLRHDELITTGKKPFYDTTFSPTKSFMQYCVDNIVLLAFDECHFAKNDTTQNQSCAALIRAVRRARNIRKDKGSYFIFLSATPLDREKQAANYFKLIGCNDPVATRDMFVKSGRRDTYSCYLEALDYDKIKAKELAIKYGIIDKRGLELGSGNSVEAIQELWLECVLSQTQHAMIDTTIKQVYNAFFEVRDDEDLFLIERAHRILLEAEKLSHEGRTGESLKKMTQSGELFELGMARTMVRAAYKNALSTHKHNKVILAFTYISSVDRAEDEMRHYYQGKIGRIGGIYSGKVSRNRKTYEANREDTINEFQKSDAMRVLFTTKGSGGTSIGYHDQIGGRQRFLYMSGDYNTTRIQQLAGRVGRFGTQSIPFVMVCYPKKLGPNALRIYNSNAKHSVFMRRALEIRSGNGVDEKTAKLYNNFFKVPGEYDRYFEMGDIGVYMTDKEIYDIVTGECINPDTEYGWIETDDEEGRKKYRDTDYLMKYLEKRYYSIIDKLPETDNDNDHLKNLYNSVDLLMSKNPGIYYATPVDGTINPYPKNKHPNVVILKPTP